MMITKSELDVAIASSEHTTALLRAMQPDVPVTAELYTHYNSAFLGTHTYHIVGVDADGNPGVPPVHGDPFWSTAGATPDYGIVTWGNEDEHQGLLTNNGEQWAALLYYGKHDNPKIKYPEQVLQCDWINIDTNVNRDMTYFTNGPVGGIMCPQILPPSGHFRCRQWGKVWNGLQQEGGEPDHYFYWQCDYWFGGMINNPAWIGTGPKNRLAIKYSEIFCSQSFANGGGPPEWNDDGSSPIAPWQNDRPVVPSPFAYLSWNAFGKDAGTLWRNDQPTYKVSLENVT